MFTGRPSSTATAIPAGPAAQEDDQVTRFRRFADYIFRRGCCNNCTALQPRGLETIMIYLCYPSCSNSHLVSVSTIAQGCPCTYLPLGQFSLHGLLNRSTGISAATYPHSLINIGPAR